MNADAPAPDPAAPEPAAPEPAAPDPATAPGVDGGEPDPGRRPFPRPSTLLIGAIVVLAGIWLAKAISDGLVNLDIGGLEHPYLVLSMFVVFDAVIPVFPSESLLNTASTLVAQGTSDLEIWRLIVAGSIGAIVGDSLLYWISRTILRRTIEDRVERAQQNEKVAKALGLLGDRAGVLIVFGRFIPGMRFVAGATMGLMRFPYGKFLLWDSIGSVSWASFTCLSSYLVGSVIDERPVLSIAVSVVLTTALLAGLYRPLRRSWEAQQVPSDAG